MIDARRGRRAKICLKAAVLNLPFLPCTAVGRARGGGKTSTYEFIAHYNRLHAFMHFFGVRM